MNEEELKKIIEQLEKDTEGMTDDEKEIAYRIKLMPIFSTGVIGDIIRTLKDATLINLVKRQGVIGEEQGSETFRRVSGVSMRRFATLIRLIKGKKTLKIGHAGILPFKVELPMKNLNRLQTKLEKLVTEETKFLTAEQLAQRAQYATYMKKEDSDNLMIELHDNISAIIDINTPSDAVDEIINYLTPIELRDHIWVDSAIEFGKINTGMNNIFKVPIILAREGIQEYQFQNDDGSIRKELHLKSYPELKKAIRGLDILHMIVEHKESWNYGDSVGCVRQIVADPKIRAIRGMGYFKKDSIPKYLLDILSLGLPFSVSIGFLAEKGEGGEFDGKTYDYIQKNMQLDHLAICIDSTPRCSLPDCGGNVEKFEGADNTEFTIIKKNEYYYNINSIIFDSKETIEKKPQEEILGDNQDMDDIIDAKPDKPEDQEEMLGKLKAWLKAMTPEKKSSLKDQVIKLFGDNKDMDEKEYVDALAKKDAEMKVLSDRFRNIYIKEIKSFTDKYSDADLDVMSLEKLEIVSDVVSDPKIRKDSKPDVLPMEGKDKKDLKDKERPERIDPAEIFSDTNKGFIMDSFIATNFGKTRQ
ncbi:hypothetical protein LCGC14_1325540 [marine sediment metagenome]|uniref:Uncharacterized protein n=1 Tax=marine sediment metagenome TaxID=412755 RepID=A0A0F9KID1_9ZZZZ